mmetsp:Transcript_3770/g.10431  ORF Transcript_3770/g.10431 Transcript_3770/m.10431 type:complete len:302 (+) Transcript_3770:673-1578(+)
MSRKLSEEVGCAVVRNVRAGHNASGAENPVTLRAEEGRALQEAVTIVPGQALQYHEGDRIEHGHVAEERGELQGVQAWPQAEWDEADHRDGPCQPCTRARSGGQPREPLEAGAQVVEDEDDVAYAREDALKQDHHVYEHWRGTHSATPSLSVGPRACRVAGPANSQEANEREDSRGSERDHAQARPALLQSKGKTEDTSTNDGPRKVHHGPEHHGHLGALRWSHPAVVVGAGIASAWAWRADLAAGAGVGVGQLGLATTGTRRRASPRGGVRRAVGQESARAQRSLRLGRAAREANEPCVV